jgi:hypothetical protein
VGGPDGCAVGGVGAPVVGRLVGGEGAAVVGAVVGDPVGAFVGAPVGTKELQFWHWLAGKGRVKTSGPAE